MLELVSKSLGGHFACLCRVFEFYEVKKKKCYYFWKRKWKYFYTFIIFLVKSLQKEQNSINLLLWPPICRNKPAITQKWFNSLDTNSNKYSNLKIKMMPINFFGTESLKLYLLSMILASSSIPSSSLIIFFLFLFWKEEKIAFLILKKRSFHLSKQILNMQNFIAS